MTSYENALIATERLLRRVGETYWADRLLKDISDWREFKDTTHHRSGYGCMGSFNDICICSMNGHKIAGEQKSWVNVLFTWLKAVLFHVMQNPQSHAKFDELTMRVGVHNPSLSAFVGGDRVPDSRRGFVTNARPLSGWRCLDCGYSRITSCDIESFIASQIIPAMVFKGCEDLQLEKVVDAVLSLDIPHLNDIRLKTQKIVKKSGIECVHDETWLWDCPKCQSKHTAVYRWSLIAKLTYRFTPSNDNLPLKKTINKAWWKIWQKDK
jgi:hypothetical protein